MTSHVAGLTLARPDGTAGFTAPVSLDPERGIGGVMLSEGEDVRMRIEVDERERQYAWGRWTARKVDDGTPSPAVVTGNAGLGSGLGGRAWLLIGHVDLGVTWAVLQPFGSR